MNALYQIERWPLGWLICVPGHVGIPMNAINECLPLFPKGAVMHSGIAHHYNATRGIRQVIVAVASPQNFGAWEQQIEAALKDKDPQDRWWYGTDVGKSSAAIFHVFCRDGLKWWSNELGQKATPMDAADFGRCKRLLDAIPEWRGRLNEVAAAYPDTAWPKIVERWPELEAATPTRQMEILRECNLS